MQKRCIEEKTPRKIAKKCIIVRNSKKKLWITLEENCNIVPIKRTMISKIKINLTTAESDQIFKDAKAFHFTKGDGTPNIGAFMNSLIVYLVDFRKGKIKNFISSTKNRNSSKQKIEEYPDILSQASEQYFENQRTFLKQPLNSPISFRPSSQLVDIYDELMDMVPNGSSLSDYLRNMIVGYLTLSACYKIPIVCGLQFKRISESFEYQRCLNLSLGGDRKIVRPYSLLPNEDNSKLLIVGLVSEMGDPIEPFFADFLDVCESAFLSAEYCDFDADELAFLSSFKPGKDITSQREEVPAGAKIECVVEMNSKGLSTLQNDFPMVSIHSTKEAGVYKLVGGEKIIYSALLCLGSCAYCLKPLSLQTELRNAFRNGLDAYDSNGLLLEF